MAKQAKRNYAPWVIAAAVLLLVVSSISFFITTNIFDSSTFSAKATEAITSETSVNAISSEITTELLEDRSFVAKRILNEPVQSIVASILTSDASETVIQETTYSINQFLTTRDFEPITISIVEITNTLDNIVDTLQPDNDVSFASVQKKEIVLFDDLELPPFKSIGQVLMIVGPLSFLLLLGTGFFAYTKLKDKKLMLKHVGTVLAISGVILYMLTFTSGSLLTLSIVDPERSIIMQEIFDTFISNFRLMQIWMMVIGLSMLMIWRYRLVEKSADYLKSLKKSKK
jgi:hypothetical protein